jgi:hypothetical protein
MASWKGDEILKNSLLEIGWTCQAKFYLLTFVIPKIIWLNAKIRKYVHLQYAWCSCNLRLLMQYA